MFSKLIATTAVLALLCASSTGCASALIDGGLRELQDHGGNARYENKSYGEHVIDSFFEGDEDDASDDECHTTTVIIVGEG
jgi:hypothetical protein